MVQTLGHPAAETQPRQSDCFSVVEHSGFSMHLLHAGVKSPASLWRT